MIEPLIQRTPHQCAIATISTATGKDYDHVLRAALDTGEYVEGKGCRSEGRILKALGYSDDFEQGQPVGDFVCRRRPYEISAEFFRGIAWGRRAIFTVPSLNKKDGWHSVYWTGRQVLDPNPPDRARYLRFQDLLPSEMILFREDLR